MISGDLGRLTSYELPSEASTFLKKEGLAQARDLLAFDLAGSASFGDLSESAKLRLMSLQMDLRVEAAVRSTRERVRRENGEECRGELEPLFSMSLVPEGAPPEAEEDIVAVALRRFQQQLLDLTARIGNQLLNFRETANTIRIVDELPDQTFDFLVRQGKSMTFLPLPDTDEEFDEDEDEFVGNGVTRSPGTVSLENELPVPNGQVEAKHVDDNLQTPLPQGVLEGRLRKIKSNANTTIQETGVNLLHLAIGFVEWCKPEEPGRTHRAPLLVVPLQLVRERLNPAAQTYEYSVNYTGEDIEPCNLSLRELMAQDFDLVLPEFGENERPDDYLARVKAVVARQKGWRVSREMVIGFFSYTKFLMFRDLAPSSWPKGCGIASSDIVRTLLGGKEPELDDGPVEPCDVDRDDRASRVPLVIDADSSQHDALVDALEGRSVVIHGPPGTGKSQTITNLIAAAMHAGKTVLFVSEKMAALDVVRRNLDAVGLGDFCLELHSAKMQKRRLLDDIRLRLERQFKTPESIGWKLESLRKAQNQLNHYAEQMRQKVGPYGEELWRVLGKADVLRQRLPEPALELRVDGATALTRQELEHRLGVLGDIGRLLKELPPVASNPWNGFFPAKFLPGDEVAVGKIVARLHGQLAAVDGLLGSATREMKFPLPANLQALQLVQPSVISELPSPPDEVVQRLLTEPSLEKLETLRLLEGKARRYVELRTMLADAASSLADAEQGELDTLASDLAELCGMGLQETSPSELASVGGAVQELRQGLSAMSAAAHELAGVASLQEQQCSMDSCRRLLALGDLVLGLQAQELGALLPEFCESSAVSMLGRCTADHEAIRLLEEELVEWFDLAGLPSEEELRELAATWRSLGGGLFPSLSSRMRQARRTVRAFAATADVVKQKDLHVLLQKAVEYLKQKRDFNDNATYAGFFGAPFRGLSTDLALLAAVVDCAQKLSDLAGGPSSATALVRRLADLRHALRTPTERLRLRVEAVDACLAALPEALRPQPSLASEMSVYAPLEALEKGLDNATRIADRAGAVAERHPALAGKSLTDCHEAVQTTLQMGAIEREVADLAPSLAWMGDHFRGIETDTESARATVAWADRLASSPLAAELQQWLKQESTGRRYGGLMALSAQLAQRHDAIENALEELRGFGAVDRRLFLTAQGPHVLIADVVEKLKGGIEATGHLVRWSQYVETKREAHELGCTGIVELLEAGTLCMESVGDALLFATYNGLGREALVGDPYLRNFKRVSHERVQEEYRKLDRQMMKLMREQVAADIAERKVPLGRGTGRVKEFTELQLLRHELAKKTRHVPTRQLIRRASGALQALKPCFMMSPLSVAQYLAPGKVSFDMVVMDEASQIRPEDGIGAVARARQLVVVGDPKQLPPTSFFDRMEGHEDEEEMVAAEQAESILEVAGRCYRSKNLIWHYRSRHESLIDFSNKQFYDGNLIVFPSPAPGRGDLGIRHHFVPGAKYTGGRGKRVNREEAKRVAEAAVRHMIQSPQQTLGIATFNISQKDLIEELVEKLAKENRQAERTQAQWESMGAPFFVKNLENVQGDERDVVFISTTYGPDHETGRVYQRFGPLGGEMGWRRLNVLVTRARRRVEVFTSMRNTDVRGGPEVAFGVRALRDYLQYAETGRHVDRGVITGREPDSDFEVAVGAEIQRLGYKVEYQVGVAGYFVDIGVLHPDRPGEFLVGVECDGAAYHSGRSARDRDRLRQEVLERLGWNIHRIWSTDWFLNRDVEVGRLAQMLEKLRHEPAREEEKQPSVVMPVSFSAEPAEEEEPEAAASSPPRPTAPQAPASAAPTMSIRLAPKPAPKRVPRPAPKPAHKPAQKAPQKPVPKPAAPRLVPLRAKDRSEKQRKEELRRLLVIYRERNVAPHFKDRPSGLLRKEMLQLFIDKQPTTRNEFLTLFPLHLREKTDKRQLKFLDDVLDIIEEVLFGV